MTAAMPRPVVRTAEQADVKAMAEVHVAAWQVGYRGMMPDGLLAGLTVERSIANWTSNLSSDQSATTSLVGEVDGRILGICTFGSYRPVDGQPPPADLCELWMLNVHPDAWGTGVAQTLMGAILDGLRAERTEPKAALWVLDANARGRRFYEKEGWSADGSTKRETFDGQELTEVRYSLAL